MINPPNEGDLSLDDDDRVDTGTPFQILALSGGGYRGLYTAILLEELERRARKPLRQCFDLITGTSIGGILAIGLAANVPAVNLRRAFSDHGQRIFPRTRRLGPVTLPRLRLPALFHRYSSTGLKATIATILGPENDNANVEDVPVGLLIPTVNTTAKRPTIFSNRTSGSSAKLLDIALATSAAPTYFPEHRIGQENYVDGGVIANAPDLLAFGEALRSGHTRSTIRILSIGTIEANTAEAPRPATGTGWATGAKALFELTLKSQQDLAIEECRRLLKRRYLRIDATASPEQMQQLGLDDVDVQAQETLKALASATFNEQLGANEADLRLFLSHRAEWTNSPS